MADNLLTNVKVLEKWKSDGQEECVHWLMLQNCSIPMASKRAHEAALQSLRKRKRVLQIKISKNPQIFQQFLEEEFRMPNAAAPRRPRQQFVGGLDKTPQLDAVNELAKELNIAKQILQEKEVELNLMKKTHKATVRQLNSAKRQKIQMKQKLDMQSNMERANVHLQERLANKTLELKRTMERERYLQKKMRRTDGDVNTQKPQTCQGHDELLRVIAEQQKVINDLTNENEDLQLLGEDNKSKEVAVFDDVSKVYCPELKNCVWDLLKNNVNPSKVSPVIERVLELVDMKANKLPARSTVLNMKTECLGLAKKELVEEVCTEETIVVDSVFEPSLLYI